ncbi:MAG: ribosome biogenesis GTPase Der [Bacteroidetes bacterium HGW-Bacteroidetes-9]|jgi:GTP-binding protein|nr:MAG: ribosome biogenesis GTPase Der [Bacteroidetes bacterium HGW-Bacteroidetes-9]
MSNIIAIVGRPNVGKSTLFNRLTGERAAIVDPTSGVTRDRHYGVSDWNGTEFSVIDTGGVVIGSDDVFEDAIRKQVELAMEEADVILFMVDVKEGLSPLDEDVANLIRRSPKKVFLVANKVDNAYRSADAVEFYSMGFDKIYEISAINGSGTGDLLDDVVKVFADTVFEEVPDLPKIAFVGRPNVGKSSMINALLGDERNIVTPIPGTTRDSIYTRYKTFGFDFLLVDTAGLRKKGKVTENIEFYSVMRSIRAIESSDICVLMLDATQGIESQDINIFSLAQKNHKGIVVVVNKWDLVEKENNTHKDYEALIRSRIAPFTDVPIIFTSVINKQRIHKTLETVKKVHEARSQSISTRKLMDIILPIVTENPPPAVKGKFVKVKYITQLKLAYPAFVFFCNMPQYVADPYKRFVENRLREKFDFNGVPIEIFYRQK